ncbi:MAG: hypothetical protein J6K43_09855 [Lachnospiraceae bacterium]|nr:hypothetical protein [Lachnospiraceae bacterium]
MKMKLKQSIKSIMAFGMALMMTLMPIGNVLPEVSVYAAGATVTITADEYITGLSLEPSSGDAIEGTPDTDNKFTFADVSAGTYTITPTFVSGMDSKFIITNDSITIADADDTKEVSTVVKDATDVTITVGAGASLKSVNGTTLGGTTYSIAQNTPAGGDVVIKIEMTDHSKEIDTVTPSATPVYSIEGNKRIATITYKVAELVKMDIPAVNVMIKDSTMYSITKDANTTVTIPNNAFCREDATHFYKPLSDAEKFDLSISAKQDYEIYTFTVGGDDKRGSITGGTYEINTSSAGNVVVTSLGLAAPTGTFSSASYGTWLGTSDTATVTYTVPTADLPVNLVAVQMAVKDNDETPAEGDWVNVSKEVQGSDAVYTQTVNYSSNVGTRKVYVRYKSASLSTSWLASEGIKFDYTAPTNVSASLMVNGTNKGGLNTDYIVNAAQNSGNQVAIRINADSESPLKEVFYSFDGATWYQKSFTGNYCDIPYTFGNKSEELKYYITDDVGNSLGNEASPQILDISKIKFDLTAPAEPTVNYYEVDAYGTVGTEITDISKWLTENVKVVISPADTALEAPTNEVMSGLPDNNAVVVQDENDNPITVQKDGSNYYFTLSDNKEHKFTISVYDKAGNVKTTSEIVVKIDKAGLTISEFTVGGSTTGNAFSNAVESKVTVTSVSGLNRVDFVFHDNETGTEKTVTGTINQNVATCSFPINEFQDGFDGYVQAVCYDNAFDSLEDPSDINHKKSIQMNKVQYSKDGAGVELLASQLWTNQIVPVAVHVTSPKTDIVKVIYYVDGVEIGSETSFSNVHDVNTTLKIDKGSASPEGTEVVVKAITNSGLETSNSIRVYIDKQSPTVTLGGVTEGATYNSARSLQITTNDNIWQKLQPVSVTATKTIDGNTTNIDLGSYTVDSANHVMSKAFSEDGIYNVTVKAVDAAGNSDTKTISFTVDRTAPVISMSGVKEGAYSSNPVTVTFQSVESFFDTNNVKITVERKIEGSTYERTLTFNNTGKTSNLANTFTEDGDYTITMTAIDRAGNEATPQTISFTVDCTAPVVTLTGTKDYFVTNQPVTLDFLVKEAYFETNQVQIRGSHRLTNGKTEAINISGWSNTGISSSLSNEFTEDGYYTITISATDKAGNNKQQTIHFTIDTEAPVIGDLSQYDGKYLSSFELKESLEDLISELSVPTVKMTLNGEAYDGHEITEDGKYTLVIEVVDEVGLSSTKSVEFVIDKTAPKIIFAGVEDKKTYTEAVRLNLSLENESDTIVEILINGEPYELTEGQSSYDISFDTFGDYEVVVLTIDEAGNDNSQTIQFTYAEHKNMAFLWIVIGAVVVAAGLVIFLVVKSKKK